jgi:hypothetical protein
MGSSASTRKDYSVTGLDSTQPPAFSLVPELVSKTGKCAYVLAERTSLKFRAETGLKVRGEGDGFKLKRITGQGQSEDALKIKQPSSFSIELQTDISGKGGKVVAVACLASCSLATCFYIYTVEKPFEGAIKGESNQKLDGELLYCWGYIQKAGWITWSYDLFEYYKGETEDNPSSRPLYRMVKTGWVQERAVYKVSADGGVNEGNEVAGFTAKEGWQMQIDANNEYVLEVGAGVDGALLVLAMCILDNIDEDNTEQANAPASA